MDQDATRLKQILKQLVITKNSWNQAVLKRRPITPEWPAKEAEVVSTGSLRSFIDHTLLKPDATDSQIKVLCDETIKYSFASVCVNSCHVAQCALTLTGYPSVVCGVVGFPLGAMTTATKVFETRAVIADGGREIDMVMNIGKLKSRDFDFVREDIAAVCDAAGQLPVKVILETGLLTEDEITLASAIAVLAGAAFVKTSTGFGHGGATEDHIFLMRQIVGPQIGVKASGGVRDAATALKMIAAGANRIGTSNGVAIVTESSNASEPNNY